MPLYTRTAIFAILCVLVVFILSIYCQGSLRHILFAGDADARAHEAQAAEEQHLQLAAQTAIDALPTFKYHSSNTEQDTCAVCLEEYAERATVRELPCKVRVWGGGVGVGLCERPFSCVCAVFFWLHNALTPSPDSTFSTCPVLIRGF